MIVGRSPVRLDPDLTGSRDGIRIAPCDRYSLTVLCPSSSTRQHSLPTLNRVCRSASIWACNEGAMPDERNVRESVPIPEDPSPIMRAANQGDDDAYRRVLLVLSKRLRVHVQRGLARVGREPADCEDIVQDTLLAIHLKRHTWDEAQPLMPWVSAIAHHKLVDHLRRKGFRQHVDIADYADTLGTAVPEHDAAPHDCMRLLADVPVRERRIVEGMSIEGRSAREVGQELGMTDGAVRVALHRTLKALATRFARGQS